MQGGGGVYPIKCPNKTFTLIHFAVESFDPDVSHPPYILQPFNAPQRNHTEIRLGLFFCDLLRHIKTDAEIQR